MSADELDIALQISHLPAMGRLRALMSRVNVADLTPLEVLAMLAVRRGRRRSSERADRDRAAIRPQLSRAVDMTGDGRSFVGPGLGVFEWHQAIQAQYSRFRFSGAQS